MMSAFVIGAGVGLLLVLIVWIDRAHARTWRQRQLLNDYIYDQRDWWRLWNELDQVPYERHFRAVLLGRDPAGLYSAQLATALAGEVAR
ncbi:MAG: hypothetical protein J0I54_20515 [Bosea sp.]|uniref:hypothetical protein n=1 Tax=unclassified Bosea (in: a-proteobacteria) TaxID=2653178 RepID=UPI00095B7455|nr:MULTISPECIES: hypothetical protein [unclassified Bosea (in: a-proteobacteria)]MBN9459023.1 hypothetical protein [Bosea sp. (in: a-proteobacteria)]OJV06234.1 MAG: hypothetical protein BGO20_08230 [Bosea sp. 67-29]